MTEDPAPIVFVICGAGGAGKGTLVTELVERDDSLHLSRSWTTRPRRPNESEDAYVYVTENEFVERIAEDGFYEWATFFDYRYGTPTPDVPAGKDLLLEIDVQGAVAVRERQPDAVVVLVVPPDRREQERRMRSRGDSENHIKQRLDAAEAEEQTGRSLADAVVLNEELQTAVAEIESVISAARAQKIKK
ncbi:MAG: guanylate kinase [Actinomycetota bacterium]|nr:guanylate kinase [Actinomycetota bacterium]